MTSVVHMRAPVRSRWSALVRVVPSSLLASPVFVRVCVIGSLLRATSAALARIAGASHSRHRVAMLHKSLPPGR